VVAQVVELNYPNPISDPRDFFDREEPFELLTNAVTSGVRAAVIMGERVTGKTSLLNMVIRWAEQQPTLASFQLPFVESAPALMKEILAGIASRNRVTLTQLGLGDPNGWTVGEFVHIAHELCASSGRTYLACLDELDSMLVECPDDAAAKQILALVAHIVNSSLPVKFVFTMTRMTSHITQRDSSPFASSAAVVKIGSWSDCELDKFVGMLLAGERQIEQPAVQALFEAGGGHPYMTKAILNALMRSTSSAPGATISAEDIRTAVSLAINAPEVELTLKNIVTVHFTADDLFLLRYLANAARPVHPEELAGYLPVFGELHRREYLRLTENGYEHAYGLLAKWLLERPEANALPRPAVPSNRTGDSSPRVDVPRLVVDETRRRVFVGETEVQLADQSYRFVAYMVSNAGRVMRRASVAHAVWPDDKSDADLRQDALNALLYRVRHAIGPNAHTYIEARRGLGYYANPDHVQYVGLDTQ
jgi:DNA-binding winged helix-turn-helix (wHTH) protein